MIHCYDSLDGNYAKICSNWHKRGDSRFVTLSVTEFKFENNNVMGLKRSFSMAFSFIVDNDRIFNAFFLD